MFLSMETIDGKQRLDSTVQLVVLLPSSRGRNFALLIAAAQRCRQPSTVTLPCSKYPQCYSGADSTRRPKPSTFDPTQMAA